MMQPAIVSSFAPPDSKLSRSDYRFVSPAEEVVYLVDDDWFTRESVRNLLTSLNIKVFSFGTAQEYASHRRNDRVACLILNLHLSDLGGFRLQEQLNEQTPPVIFMAVDADIPTAVRAVKAGAIEFLLKPINTDALVAAVRAAFAQDRKSRQRKAELTGLRERFARLTPREREVLPLIVGGLVNKQSASLLGISKVTLQIHRNQIMRKMQADSFADLVRMSVKLRIRHWCENPASQRHGRLPIV